MNFRYFSGAIIDQEERTVNEIRGTCKHRYCREVGSAVFTDALKTSSRLFHLSKKKKKRTTASPMLSISN